MRIRSCSRITKSVDEEWVFRNKAKERGVAGYAK